MFGLEDGTENPRDPLGPAIRYAGDSGMTSTALFASAAYGSLDVVPDSDRRPAAAAAAPRHGRLLIRICDILIALIAMVLLLPVLLVTAALVFVTDPGPIFFAHRRIGEDGRHFHCLKFRSMARNADVLLHELLASDEQARLEWETYHKLSSDPRILPLGRFLRKSSLDELPQLWNVLRGDMSVVGPRPIVPEEQWRYGRYLHHYLNCRPGITGLWQISGRSNTTYRRRVALDVTWSRSRSFRFYCWILLRTVPSVLTAHGSA